VTTTQIAYWNMKENQRHDKVGERLTRSQIKETVRHDKSTEKLTKGQLKETKKHNRRTEKEQKRSNQAREREQRRADLAREALERRLQDINYALQNKKLSQEDRKLYQAEKRLLQDIKESDARILLDEQKTINDKYAVLAKVKDWGKFVALAGAMGFENISNDDWEYFRKYLSNTTPKGKQTSYSKKRLSKVGKVVDKVLDKLSNFDTSKVVVNQ